MGDIADTRILIIGGTSGIGRAVAEAARSRGAAVFVASRSAAGPGAFRVDVDDSDSIAALASEVGGIRHLVVTAGARPPQRALSDVRPGDAVAALDRVVRTIEIVRLMLPALDERGSVVLTGTTTAVRGGPGRLLAAAVGGALVSVTRSLAVELAPIRVNLVAPGVVRTPLWDPLGPEARERLFDAVAAGSLSGRVSDPADLAPAYLRFLELDQVTGETTLVDGGATLA